jgi:Flp pilus assembly protein TadD
MARSFGAIRAGAPADIFPEGSYRHDASQQIFAMSRKDGLAYLKRQVAGPEGRPGEEREARADYWIGSGLRGRGFAHRARSGKLILLPVTFYANRQWNMNPGYDRPDHAGFERPIDYRCLSCHAGYPQMPAGEDLLPTGSRYPADLVEGIDCQRCHGPGQRHVEAVRKGEGADRVRAAIVNPARLSVERRMEVCMQCHLETTSEQLPAELIRFDRGVFSYRPGEPLSDWVLSFDYPKGTGHDDRFEFVSSVYRLRQSACFQKSRGEMTCTTCHNPHDIPRGEAAARHYSSVCQKCHGASPGKSHPAATECISCHMPVREPSDAPHIRITDHFIRRTPQAPPSTPKTYRGSLVAYYPPDLPQTPENELYLAVAQVTQQTNLEQGVTRLDKLVRQHRPGNAEFYLQLGSAWRSRGQLDKSREWLEEAVKRAPKSWRPLVLLAGTVAAMGDADRAVRLLRDASALSPAEPAPLQQLGDLYAAQGKAAEAAAAYRSAIQADPEFAEAHNGLGAVAMSAGDATGAEAALREAVRLRPEWPQARANLASLFALTNRIQEARYHFELALRINPSFVSAHSAYATALAENGMLAEARRHYEQALRLNPSDAVTHQNLGTTLRRLGSMEEAIREYQAAIRLDPNSYEAHLALGEIYVARNQRSAAAAHLRQAVRSPDPEVRQSAAALLTP